MGKGRIDCPALSKGHHEDRGRSRPESRDGSQEVGSVYESRYDDRRRRKTRRSKTAYWHVLRTRRRSAMDRVVASRGIGYATVK